MVLLACAFLMTTVVLAIFADLIAPRPYTEINLRERLEAPSIFRGSLEYPFGTDELGRDVLSRLLQSIRISLLIGIIGTAIGAILGTCIGFVAAHFGGIVDDFIMMLVDFMASMPFMIFALMILAFFKGSLYLVIGLIGVQGWERYARLARGMTLSATESGYAVAVKLLGAKPPRIYFRHILPNISSALIVNITLNFPSSIILESGLSFLGLGIQPPMTSLGNMLGFGRAYLTSAWWIAVFPAITIFLMTLSMSILGDWLRDRLDPTVAVQRGG